MSNATEIIIKLKIHFSRLGIPELVIEDNGSQFACEEFKVFTKRCRFEHVKPSPLHPPSTRNVENKAQITKLLMQMTRRICNLHFRTICSESGWAMLYTFHTIQYT